MSDEKKPFTVTDRRHFTPEGEARDEGVNHPAAQPLPAGGATEPAPDPAAGAAEPDAPHVGPGGPEEGEARFTLPADFSGLLLSLGAQASLLLGVGLPGGEQTAPPPDLEGARSVIGLLEVLKEKTEGRRTPEEERILEGLLYELRMAYVATTRAGGA